MQSIPVDREVASQVEVNTTGNADTVTLTLTKSETKALLEKVTRVFQCSLNEALVTSLALAMGRWTGHSAVRINLEGHGRENLFDDVDVSRTVGWFTTLFPLNLHLPDSPELAESMLAVREQMGAVPNGGIGYGLLMAGEMQSTLSKLRPLCPGSFQLSRTVGTVLSGRRSIATGFRACGSHLRSGHPAPVSVGS